MNRQELIAAVAQRSGTPATTVDSVLAAFAGVVTDQVARGDKVQVPGFVTFEAVDRQARTGRNPATGETMTIPARKAVRISAGTALKRAVAGG